MGKDLAGKFPAARQVFEEADEALGFALSDLCFNGPAEQLQLTENTQPAILATSIAALRAMQAENFPAPDFVAGHSLGEYSALVAANGLLLSDAIKTVRARGRYMLDYWGLSFKEASDKLLAKLAERGETQPPPGRRWIIATCGPHRPAQVGLGPNFETTWDSKGADFALMLGEFYCARLDAPVLAEVAREQGDPVHFMAGLLAAGQNGR